ncbi:hypothetical protein J6590_030484 [Homalodisca vitripennis]|nr:hypothetical protein J6590_030484 [Homalodisca vitripennis]
MSARTSVAMQGCLPMMKYTLSPTHLSLPSAFPSHPPALRHLLVRVTTDLQLFQQRSFCDERSAVVPITYYSPRPPLPPLTDTQGAQGPDRPLYFQESNNCPIIGLA